MIKMAILAHDGYQSVMMGHNRYKWVWISNVGSQWLLWLILGIIGSCWVLLDHNLCLVIGFNGA